jgi:hypothetical protein
MQKLIIWKLAAAALGLLAAPAISAAQGDDELWEMTTRMEMPGMPVAMPARTYQMCIPKGSQQDQTMPKDPESDCKTVESKTSGNKTTFKMVCNGKNQMTMTGETIRTGDTIETKSHMTFEGKRAKEMTQTTTGKRVGTCDAAQAEAEAAQARAETQARISEAQAGMCYRVAESLDWKSFREGQQCSSKKAALCEEVDKLRQPEQLKLAKMIRPTWKDAAKFCGQKPEEIEAAAAQAEEEANTAVCQSALDKGETVPVKRCESFAIAHASQICGGREFTGASWGSELHNFCLEHAKDELKASSTRPGSEKGSGNSAADMLKDVTKGQLKKLLPF